MSNRKKIGKKIKKLIILKCFHFSYKKQISYNKQGASIFYYIKSTFNFNVSIKGRINAKIVIS